MQRISVPNLDNILGEKFKVLDSGFIRIIDYMGDESAIVQAARVSYGEGTKKSSEDRNLLRYMYRNMHVSPFEMAEIKLHVKLPIFVARQWVRHRTASLNELSARYSVLNDEFYIPETFYEQSTTNKQGSGVEIDSELNKKLLEIYKESCSEDFEVYEQLLNSNVSRELSRLCLPVSTYTEWYWKIDLSNLLKFLSLRVSPHAQKEIQEYAKIICDIVKLWMPNVYEAFEDYNLNSFTFSASEINALRDTFKQHPQIFTEFFQKCSGSSRELANIQKILETNL